MKQRLIFILSLVSSLFILNANSSPSAISSTALYGAWPANNNTSANLGVATTPSNINPSNAASLQQMWSTFGFDATAAHAVDSTPVLADGNVYVAEAGGTVRSYKEVGSGTPVLNWVSPQLTDDKGNPEAFDESPVLTKDFIFIAGQRMHKLSRATGQEVVPPMIYDPVLGPHFVASEIEPSQLMIAGDKVIYGIGYSDEAFGGLDNPLFPFSRGEIIAFNQSDLSIAWKLDLTVYKGTQYGVGGGTFAGGGVDEKRHLLFWGVGNQYLPPASPISNSLLAINYNTGKIVWSYQYAPDDVWGAGGTINTLDGNSDLDVHAHPQIFSLQLIPGNPLSTLDLVGARGKDGTYRIFTRDQLFPNHIVPIAQVQVDPGTTADGGIQIEPVIKDGILYISSTSYIDPANPQAHSSLDFLIASSPLGQFSSLVGATTTVRAIDLRKLVLYGLSQLVQGNTKPVCVGTILPARCVGQLPANIVQWKKEITPFAPVSSSGLAYVNGVIFMTGIQGVVEMINASNGSIIGSFTPGKLDTPIFGGLMTNIPVLGGVSIDKNMIFVPIGINFGGTGIPFTGVAAYSLH